MVSKQPQFSGDMAVVSLAKAVVLEELRKFDKRCSAAPARSSAMFDRSKVPVLLLITTFASFPS